MSELSAKHCKPCEGGGNPMTPDEADIQMALLDGWVREGGEISKTYTFKNYYETIAFVNATAFISHREDHHPDILIGYKTCAVTFTTHAIGGLSENDFICAAKFNELVV